MTNVRWPEMPCRQAWASETAHAKQKTGTDKHSSDSGFASSLSTVAHLQRTLGNFGFTGREDDWSICGCGIIDLNNSSLWGWGPGQLLLEFGLPIAVRVANC